MKFSNENKKREFILLNKALSVLSVLTIICFSCLSHAFIEVTKTGQTVGRSVKNNRVSPSNGAQLRNKKKMGVGFNAVGNYGLLGVSLDMNFTAYSSATIGFGMGENYQTFVFHFKKYLMGRHFQPYIGFGYNRWYTTGEKNEVFNKTNPEFLAKKFLSESEKQGKFDEHFLFPSAGIQFLQLKGDWAGSSIYAELLFLIDIDDFVTAPTAGLGFVRFF
jgi:hypothetical protein